MTNCIGLTVVDLQKKMACLRTYFGKEYGKEKASKTSGTGTKQVYTSKWPFFASLQFLRDNITPRKTSNIPETSSVIGVKDAINIDSPEENAGASVCNDKENMTPELDSGNCVFNVSNAPSQKSKRKLQMMKEDELMTACLQELKKPRESSDADTIFGKYIANQLSKIPEGYAKEMLKLELQQSIMKVMNDIHTTAYGACIFRQPFNMHDHGLGF